MGVFFPVHEGTLDSRCAEPTAGEPSLEFRFRLCGRKAHATPIYTEAYGKGLRT